MEQPGTAAVATENDESSDASPSPLPGDPPDRRHHLIGEKRAVPADEWAEIRRAYYSDHRDIRSIAHEHGLRRAVVRAVISPWA